MASELTPGAADFIRAVNEFIFVEDEPRPADVIFVPGASHPEHAMRAAELYRAGMAPFVLPSGRFSVTLGRFKGVPEEHRADYPDDYATECDFLRAVLLKHGVPDEAILREDQATYTWENAQFSQRLLAKMGITPRRAILCCRAFHARRALTYYQAALPDTTIIVCPTPTPGSAPDDWYLTPKGRARVLGEVSRMGSQIVEVFEGMVERGAGLCPCTPPKGLRPSGHPATEGGAGRSPRRGHGA